MPKARSPRPLSHDALQAALRAQTRDIIEQLNRSQAAQDRRTAAEFKTVRDHLRTMDERLDSMETKLDALMEYVPVTRKHLHNLVRALKAKGIDLDEAEVFAT